MEKVVECVPNFSEGRDREKIDAITGEIETVDDVKLLDVDPGESTNRTVVTMVGSPDGVLEAAFRAIAKAAEVIDMSTHSGAHSRMGASDVVPFVPVAGVTMEDCVELAKKLGKRVGEELGIPVYLYENAATTPRRQNLATVRKGQYEGLPEKLKDPEWKPDFGPAEFNSRTGATIIGAREFLIAYNVNINSRDRKIAREIAFTIREKGRLKRDKNRKVVRDENGKALRDPGIFKDVKAIGWYVDDFERAQVSINLVNYKISPPHKVFDECCRIANELGARVTGSELVGLIPLEALLQAGEYFLKKSGRSTGVPQSELIHIADLSLGLSDLYPFKPEEKVIEFQIRREQSLNDMTVSSFVDELSTDSPAPGGGSVAALCGALSGALSSMVAALTHGKRKYQEHFDEMEDIGISAQKLKKQFLEAVDRDTDAFNELMGAFRMPKKKKEDKEKREEAIQEATKNATLIPLSVLKMTLEAAELARRAFQNGNRNSASDAGVAALNARAAAEGAYFNIKINLAGITDREFIDDISSEAEKIRDQVVKHTTETAEITENYLEEQLEE
ncbi:MAG: glutamate formimidoyltransferase [Candidatus Latescibacteria bacterium]|nr:glutamate formimidoyltransferase [bacterium]MBD3423871.1 glutamate formimidoyltransferase [Candidatus Latescibacterota bacterium]